jgi:hypothetical protein
MVLLKRSHSVVAASLCRGALATLLPVRHGDTAPWLQQRTFIRQLLTRLREVKLLLDEFLSPGPAGEA